MTKLQFHVFNRFHPSLLVSDLQTKFPAERDKLDSTSKHTSLILLIGSLIVVMSEDKSLDLKIPSSKLEDVFSQNDLLGNLFKQ